MKKLNIFVISIVIFTSFNSYSARIKPLFLSQECIDYNGYSVSVERNDSIRYPTYSFIGSDGLHRIEYNSSLLSLFTTPARTFLFYSSCAKTSLGERFVSNIEANCWSIRHIIRENIVPFNYIYYIEEELQKTNDLYDLKLDNLDLIDCFS